MKSARLPDMTATTGTTGMTATIAMTATTAMTGMSETGTVDTTRARPTEVAVVDIGMRRDVMSATAARRSATGNISAGARAQTTLEAKGTGEAGKRPLLGATTRPREEARAATTHPPTRTPRPTRPSARQSTAAAPRSPTTTTRAPPMPGSSEQRPNDPPPTDPPLLTLSLEVKFSYEEKAESQHACRERGKEKPPPPRRFLHPSRSIYPSCRRPTGPSRRHSLTYPIPSLPRSS